MVKRTWNIYQDMASDIRIQKLSLVEKNRLLTCLNEVAAALGGEAQPLLKVTAAETQKIYQLIQDTHPVCFRASSLVGVSRADNKHVPIIDELKFSKTQAALDSLQRCGLIQKYNSGYYGLADTGRGQHI